MPLEPHNPENNTPALLLGIDTCGPTGSVALGRLSGSKLEIVDTADLEGRTYSATLVAAIADLLNRNRIALRDIDCIIAVSGPGSFTGVRVGLSAAKGLAEGADLPLLTVSRLEVLALAANSHNAALDAHRHEIFLRMGASESLAGIPHLEAMSPASEPIAVCDDGAAAVLAKAWPQASLIRHAPPSAADALLCATPRVIARDFNDVATQDGHYLRRSDAEIFGNPAVAQTV